MVSVWTVNVIVTLDIQESIAVPNAQKGKLCKEQIV